jgi:ADP-heptose:LPS heptosyltransferase
MGLVKTLIIKLGASGDVVRTSPLLRKLGGEVTWITAAKNIVLLNQVRNKLRCLSWEERDNALDSVYDLSINLEDALDAAEFLKAVEYKQLFGAYSDQNRSLRYTDAAKPWFDLSIISRHGKPKADKLKSRNRRTYQELIFEGLGFRFTGERYLLPEPIETGLSGDVAIAAEAGPVWPMKKWAYYDLLKERLERRGLIVNFLPKRASLLEHLADVRNHACLVGGDSLPMHFALGTGTRCVTLFTCTSPWEIYDYGLQAKIISPLLEEFFYKRGYEERPTTAISVDEVFDAVIAQFEASASLAARQKATV